MRTVDTDHRIGDLARRQHGAFSRQQAFELGASRRLMDRRLAAGDWSRMAPSVYALPAHPATWFRQCKAAELCTPGAAVAGLSACALQELDGARPGPIELGVPLGASGRNPLARCHRFAGMATTTVNGIRVTTIAQTLADVAHRIPPWRLEVALDGAIAGSRLTVAELEERRDHYAGVRRPGLPLFRALVEERSAAGWTPPDSSLESALWAVLVGLPSGPRMQRQAGAPWLDDAGTHRVDILLPDHGIVVEADGRRWHTRVADFERDRWRDNRAAAAGLVVLRFTWLHLTVTPADVRDLVEQTIAARTPTPH